MRIRYVQPFVLGMALAGSVGVAGAGTSVSITQSTNSGSVTTGSSVSCNGGAPGFLHTDNSYYRAFTLSAFNPPLTASKFYVESVSIGIETANASGDGTTQPVTLRLWKSSANPPINATLSSPVEVTANVADQTLSVLSVPIPGHPEFTVASDILVVEVFTPNGGPSGHSFFLGANSLGQSGPSFIKAAPCGLADIGDLAAIGFPNMHIVMSVQGITADQPPVLPPEIFADEFE
jgi:hypothetical protein